MASELPTGQRFELRVSMHTVVSSIATACMLVLYVLPNFRLSDGQAQALLWTVAALVAGVSPLAFLAYRRVCLPISKWIDLVHAGGPIPDADRDAAFHSILSLPLQISVTALTMWLICGAGICIGQLRFEETSRFSIALMFAAVLGTACVTQVFGYVKLRRDVQPVREALVRALDDPERRAALTRRVSLSSKLTAATVSLVVTAVVLSVGMSQIQSARSAAALIAEVQSDCVSQIVDRIEGGHETELAIGEVLPFYEATVESVRVADPVSEVASAGLEGVLLQAEWEVVVEGAEAAGTSLEVDTPHSFAWAPLPDGSGRVIVVSTSGDGLSLTTWTTRVQFFGWIVVATILAIAVGRSVGSELGESTSRLEEQARRIAGGDLRVRVTVESEDEIGELARSLDVMGNALRNMLGAASEAADELESTSADVATAADQVAAGAQAQQASLADASQRLDRIRAKSGEISGSASEASIAMDESSSSSGELQASAEHLRETARALTERVEASSSSLQSSGESLGQIAQSTGALRSLADELTASVEAMAESARSVGCEAGDAGTLSLQVHEVAERGRLRVRDSIRGMQAIRESTSRAVDSAKKLEKRTDRIDDVVSVIADVAEQTRLLGLNAAIIAAQAGDSGSGFAVVATQIRELAARVRSHTHEVSELLANIRHETGQLVETVAESAERVQIGMDLASQSGEALDDITESARESGERIGRIAQEVQVQARATESTASDMENLRRDVERIGEATREQERAAAVLLQGHAQSEGASLQMHRTSEEQASAVARIGSEIEQVRAAITEIDAALGHQADACRTGAESLRSVACRSEEDERTARTMSEAMRGLLARAEALRERMGRFQL